MIEFDDFKYHKSRIPKNHEEQEQFFKNLEQSFVEEITHSEKAKAYFEKFKSSDIDYFIKGYAHTKVDVIRFYEGYNREYREKEEYEYNFSKRAEKALHAVLQKKLFNLQLKWRAGLLKIEGIDICYDFTFWQNHIESCPFIDPITVYEKDLMKEFLLNNTDYREDIIDNYLPWQDYDLLMEKDEEDSLDNMLEWYEFYDSRVGTGSLLILPNLKEAKEIFYMKLNHPPQTESPETPVEIDTRPSLYSFGKDIISFAKAFESDKYMVQLFGGYEAVYQRNNKEFSPHDIDYAVRVLLMADRRISIPSHFNWDEAIIYAAQKYLNAKTAEALDTAYNEYCMRIELNMMATETPAKLAEIYKKESIGPILKESILSGRTKNGESADFDY